MIRTDRTKVWPSSPRTTALDAAGAIAAALLFAGAEAASTAGAAQVQEGDVRLAEMERLTRANAARAIFSSKLFHSVGPSRAKPIHRVIAEYLGARWLARQAATPRAQRRLLAQLHGNGGVPASLSGLHAWLAFHSPAMAVRVIAEDPYGVLRYGDTATLTPHLADHLFDALYRLAEHDPYFRSADWDSKTAAGLMLPALQPKIDAIIGSAETQMHLRSLLIEALNGAPLAAELADTLEAILLAPERFYRERADAAEALLPYRDRAWWRATITALTDQAGEDGPRLARRLIEQIDADVPDGQLVATLFAEMGALSCPWPRVRNRRTPSGRSYLRLLTMIQPTRLTSVLNLIADYCELLGDSQARTIGAVADMLADLITRAIDEAMVGPGHAASLWRWLSVIEQAHRYQHDVHKTLAARLAGSEALRRAVQAHVLANKRRGDSLWLTEMHMSRRLVGLTGRPGDIIVRLAALADGDNKDPGRRQDWQDLVRIAWGPEGLEPDVEGCRRMVFGAATSRWATSCASVPIPRSRPGSCGRKSRRPPRERKRKTASRPRAAPTRGARRAARRRARRGPRTGPSLSRPFPRPAERRRTRRATDGLGRSGRPRRRARRVRGGAPPERPADRRRDRRWLRGGGRSTITASR